MVTSLVLPNRREATTPACSALLTSRCADDTEAPTRLASSVSVHSRPGLSKTKVSSSACNRDRSNGSKPDVVVPLSSDLARPRTVHP